MTGTTRSLLAGLLLSVCMADAVLAAAVAPDAADSVPQVHASDSSPVQTLTLPAVLDRVLRDHPALVAARATVAAGEAAARQAGSLTNPELALEMENFAGSDPFSGFAAAETTLRIDQPLELGRKRGKRRALAEAERDVAAGQADLTRAALYAQTVEAFMTLLAAQERQALAEKQLQLAQLSHDSLTAQIEAGKVSAIAGVRNRPLLIEARLEEQRAAGTLAAARTALALLLGEDRAAPLTVSGDLASLPEIPDISGVETSPQLALAAAEREQAARELAGERAQAIPDLTVGLGVRHFQETGATALVAGVSVPLPLFDRNSGGIAAASARLEAVRALEQGSRRQLENAIAQAVADFRATRAEAVALQDELVPAARESFEAIDYGYRAGKFDQLDLLDAQRQWNEVRTRLLAAQVACHVAAARLDALLGRFPSATAGAHP